jgi:hypothetical protein
MLLVRFARELWKLIRLFLALPAVERIAVVLLLSDPSWFAERLTEADEREQIARRTIERMERLLHAVDGAALRQAIDHVDRVELALGITHDLARDVTRPEIPR